MKSCRRSPVVDTGVSLVGSDFHTLTEQQQQQLSTAIRRMRESTKSEVTRDDQARLLSATASENGINFQHFPVMTY